MYRYIILLCIYIYIHIHMYIHIHTYTCIYIYIHIYRAFPTGGNGGRASPTSLKFANPPQPRKILS